MVDLCLAALVNLVFLYPSLLAGTELFLLEHPPRNSIAVMMPKARKEWYVNIGKPCKKLKKYYLFI
jgi:hypothetical protein